eukprot:TRINITY_DN927_c0_g1_i1.p1 TRINITY_DN927_c0_g1~~TRINITY_DN927_c0_g1_i1.p1  ORF type:complete len:150 (-),score=23.67 TRINITY_DN927_c0_g1_i1:140-589(-)
MARSSGRRASAPPPRAPPRAAPHRPPAPAPAVHAHPPAPQQQSSGGSFVGNMMSTIGQGLAFGTGSAVAHRAVDAVMGPRTVTHEHADSPATEASPAAAAPSTASGDSCSFQTKAFQDCVTNNGTDISKCQFYLDMLNDCKRSPQQSVF